MIFDIASAFPLQAGAGRVLSRMCHGYAGELYLKTLAQARDIIDDVAITTDINVGFPGETKEDFLRTLEVAAAAEFNNAYRFVYSPRSGTEAADMQDEFCDPEEVKDRYKRLRTVIERSTLAKSQARIGRVEEVIVEGPSKKDPTVLSGRTAHNKLLHFPSAPLPASQ